RRLECCADARRGQLQRGQRARMERRARLRGQPGADDRPDRARAAGGRASGHGPRPDHLRRSGLARRNEVGVQAMKTKVLSTAPAVPATRVGGGFPWRRLVRDISSVLIISGLLLMLDAGLTLVWQEPVTAVIGAIQRSKIDKQYLSFDTAPL